MEAKSGEVSCEISLRVTQSRGCFAKLRSISAIRSARLELPALCPDEKAR